jgi:hypothetical protein
MGIGVFLVTEKNKEPNEKEFNIFCSFLSKNLI